MPKRLLIKIALFIPLVLGLIYFSENYLRFTPGQIQTFMLSFGILAPLVFIVLYTIRPFVLFPASVMAIAGGLSFGPFIGPAATYIGSLSGAALSFIVMRKMGHRFRTKKWTGRAEQLQKNIEENGFFYILSLRIIPVINFDFLSYLSALSRVPFRTYMSATMVGIIPGTLAFNFLGASIVDLSLNMILLTVSTFIIAFSIPVIVRKRLAKKEIDIDLLPDEKI
ncbi:TVP38/TMEM64 family protein [Salisediminibacterium halotolerans]|uniref:TVP38/TMEM64 family protein n=1 Tax=Salisediminibacterium halotolerans TaxID=517425 RepID=UPI000EAC4DD8|nr:TVP38/TMEM64 family protein [Salisediminibacterium halotolerans]RLJ81011.1 putative membrane protein YdjX (TVP38/TMEM64 family) [Actinophytocola xinjiangensis]RPE87899.1 putative membrane protein YdjX (TVP38/TMEM64 family) [Salisediminibacterium halotolerans]TWG37904.1 putative membrane protein YdjX (TVP38/TMEM64 family) [Salisediminibacterium halotolerans]GEL08345.1 TVP38/TMEM64 family membrane protein YtxB [Salisediminibacterium halotolerans]